MLAIVALKLLFFPLAGDCLQIVSMQEGRNDGCTGGQAKAERTVRACNQR